MAYLRSMTKQLAKDTDPKIFTLSAVARAIENALREPMKRTFWVQAEVASPRSVGGHLYATLVELREGTAVAKMHCVIWESTLRDIRKRFSDTGLDLQIREGLKVCLLCRISFHAVYGLTLNVLDADPRFALGELELRKRALIETLAKEGADLLNKRHPVTALPLRLGLVTSREGDAYNDILRQLSVSRFGFTVLLADAFMQGENAARSILRALDVLEAHTPDLIIVARGGGNRTDLAWLDDELLARRIAACATPVWTGIGHANDHGVLDAVAHTAFETPTAVAKAIVARFHDAQVFVDQAASRLHREWQHRRSAEVKTLTDDTVGIRQGTRKLATQARTSLVERSERMEITVGRRLSEARQGYRLAAQRMRMRSEQSVASRSARTRDLRLRMEMTARHVRSVMMDRFARNRMRFDAERIARSVSARRVRAEQFRADLADSATSAIDALRGSCELGRRHLASGPWRVRFEGLIGRLADQGRLVDAHDPARTLARGYAIIYSDEDRIVTSTASLTVGGEVRIAMRDGSARGIVQSVDGPTGSSLPEQANQSVHGTHPSTEEE